MQGRATVCTVWELGTREVGAAGTVGLVSWWAASLTHSHELGGAGNDTKLQRHAVSCTIASYLPTLPTYTPRIAATAAAGARTNVAAS